MTNKTYTVAIIGGGPAGCQCALWLKMMGFDPVMIEASDHLGGLQSQSPYQNQWIVGLMDISGRDLAHNIQLHIQQKDIPVFFKANLTSVQQHANGFLLNVNGQQLEAQFIVLATGSEQQDAQSLTPASDQHSHDESFAKQTSIAWQAHLPLALRPFAAMLVGQNGFVITDENCETPVAGIFAIGEVANRMHPCVVTSMADGVVAAKAIQLACE